MGGKIMSYIEFNNVSKIYNQGDNKIYALDHMNFNILEGELCVIVGPSGAGKTTLLNILGGMDKASEGSVILDGKEITKLSGKELTEYRRTDVGFVFQFYNLIQNLTALENVELASEISKSKLNSEEVLKEVGLEKRINNFPAQLSGGEMQRVSIARALAKDPKIILCDEPTGALDYNTGKNILKLLQDTCKNSKKTVIIITHNSAITKIADRVINVKNGTATSITTSDHPVSATELEW